MTDFFKSIKDIANTRKFWAAMAGAVANALAVFLAGVPELAPLFSLLTALGVWKVTNK